MNYCTLDIAKLFKSVKSSIKWQKDQNFDRSFFIINYSCTVIKEMRMNR